MDIFDEARRTVSQDRQDTYGNPENSFDSISTIWQWWLDNRSDTGPLTAADVAIMMSLFKHARLSHTYKRDSVVDAIGYLGIYADRLNAPQTGQKGHECDIPTTTNPMDVLCGEGR